MTFGSPTKEVETVLPFNYKARPYQVPFWKAMRTKDRAVLVWHRRAGKEKTSWNYLLTRACQKVGTYYYFFPHFNQGRKILWDGIDKDGFKFLDHIPKQLVSGNPNSTEMKVRLKNGSLIQVIGTDHIDGIVGTNPIGCVFTEYALQDPKAWTLIRPILRENGGWAIFNFCVSANTLVFTKDGIKKIKDVVSSTKEGFTDVSLEIYGISGYNEATSFYNGGVKKLIRIKTKKGYKLCCTPNHPILSMSGWKAAEDWSVGDVLPIQRGMDAWGSGLDLRDWKPPARINNVGRAPVAFVPVLDEDMAYLLGLILAEGSWTRLSVTITNGDKEIIDWVNSRGFKTYDKFHHTLCSIEFVSFIEWMGLIRGEKNKEIPKKILACKKNVIAAFISGYFDGDGCATLRGGVHCDSTSEALIDQLQVILLNFGIICKKYTTFTKETKKVKVRSICHRLELTSSGSVIFFNEIGFRLERKQSRSLKRLPGFSKDSCDRIPIEKEWIIRYSTGMNRSWLKRQKSISYKKAKELLELKHDRWLFDVVRSNYFYDEVDSIEFCEENVYDFVIPETHSFNSNGFISHNTPRGANHGKELYDMACGNPDWFCQLLTVDDTAVLGPEDIQKERDEGMSEDFIQQEYFCSFTLGVEGSYYARYMEKARDEDRVGRVPVDLQKRVYTAWDLGYGDSTAIIFYQVCGQEIHIVDYYEAHGEGLPHYATVLRDRGYLYADHYAPHDIDSHAFSSGLSAREVGASLGIKFVTLPTLKLRLEDGIEAVRSLFPRLWFDEKKCGALIKCLENYRKEFEERLGTYRNRPRHDKFSHGADSIRYLSIATKIYVDAGKSGVDDKQSDKWYDQFHPRFD